MSQPAFFLCADAPIYALNIGEPLSAPQNIHAHLRAGRVRTGESVKFLSGKGHILHAKCTDEKSFRFSALELSFQNPQKPEVHLCIAPPLGDALWDALNGAVQLGVQGIHFLASEHCQLRSRGSEPPHERALRVIEAACEQCGLARIPTLNPKWNELDTLLEDSQFEYVFADEALAGVGHLYGCVKDSGGFGFTQQTIGLNNLPIRLFIGPEGGWSQSERQKLGAKAAALSLGPLVMRVPTATIAALQSLKLLCTKP